MVKFVYDIVVDGRFKLAFFSELTIESSWKTVADQALIKLGGLKHGLELPLKQGMTIDISLGYDNQLVNEFKGYISELAPVSGGYEIKCEDGFYPLKKLYFDGSWKRVSLKSLLETIVADTPITIDKSLPDITFGPYRIGATTRYGALEKLSRDIGLAVYFRKGVLFAGLPYQDGFSQKRKTVYLWGGGMPNNLTWASVENTKAQVKAIAIMPNGKRKSVTVGDKSGPVTTRYFYNIDDEKELTRRAEEAMKQMHYEGYTGSLTDFGGFQYIGHSEAVNLIDSKYPKRAGAYLVESTKVKVTPRQGYRREVFLGPKASLYGR